MSQAKDLKPKRDDNVLLPGMIDRTVLRDSEVFWRDHQKWLEDCGYMVRPRYMPDWKPSWTDKSGKMVMLYEDAQYLKVRPRQPSDLFEGAYIHLSAWANDRRCDTYI